MYICFTNYLLSLCYVFYNNFIPLYVLQSMYIYIFLPIVILNIHVWLYVNVQIVYYLVFDITFSYTAVVLHCYS